jgi:hypothetical protein
MFDLDVDAGIILSWVLNMEDVVYTGLIWLGSCDHSNEPSGL